MPLKKIRLYGQINIATGKPATGWWWVYVCDKCGYVSSPWPDKEQAEVMGGVHDLKVNHSQYRGIGLYGK